MPFALESNTKAHLNDIVVLSQKNRAPEDNPGAKLSLEMDLGADMLVHFDGGLRSLFFTTNTSGQQQGTLVTTEVLTPAGQKIGWFPWHHELTGYELVIDHGTGGKSNLQITDCKLDGWKITLKEGGFNLKFNLESEDISERVFGRLAKLKSCPIEIVLLPPELTNDLASPPAPPAKPAKAGAPAKDKREAGDAFADAHATH